MAGFKEIFSAYGGDYDATIARFMGSEAMYLRILPMLFQDENLESWAARSVTAIRGRVRRGAYPKGRYRQPGAFAALSSGVRDGGSAAHQVRRRLFGALRGNCRRI